MPGELQPALTVETVDHNAAFEAIVRASLDPNFGADPAANSAETQVPFGLFSENHDVDQLRVPMATATGWTGNNGEESN